MARQIIFEYPFPVIFVNELLVRENVVTFKVLIQKPQGVVGMVLYRAGATKLDIIRFDIETALVSETTRKLEEEVRKVAVTLFNNRPCCRRTRI